MCCLAVVAVFFFQWFLASPLQGQNFMFNLLIQFEFLICKPCQFYVVRVKMYLSIFHTRISKNRLNVKATILILECRSVL